MDYIARWLASKFLSRAEKQSAGVILRGEPTEAESGSEPIRANGNGASEAGAVDSVTTPFLFQQDAPSCHECGSIMVRNGTCYKCLNCGSTSGCS